ncbi:MAG: imidazole glycerol phosphate synthase subunit HisH [Proteobacteria bacterium]|nr:imidazole glycerol phosphate synthase subunit HisH [Pseudomonadota bacterium]
MAGTVALIDYGSGNLRSAEKALARASLEGATGHTIVVTDKPDVVSRAERIVLPGVGAFADCMAGLSKIAGMIEALGGAVRDRGVPFLGICVGMQLLATVGREFGDTKGLGWIEGDVVRLSPADRSLKIPHMGWNELEIAQKHSLAHPLLEGLGENPHGYFVHSFELRASHPSDVIATADYGGAVTAAVARGNIAGTQFHPEKSQAVGLRILRNFLGWTP